MAWKYRCLRRPRTTQERRANGKRSFLEIDGYKIKLRAKRNYRNLPNAWDDIVIHDFCRQHLCWKKLRKTRWKRIKKIHPDWKVIWPFERTTRCGGFVS